MGKSVLNMNIELTDNSELVKKAMKEQIELGLETVGEAAEGYAKGGSPVDTGRLRDSITYKTKSAQGNAGSMAEAGDYKPKGNPPELEVQIGTNVEYAPIQEFGEQFHHTTGGAHFLKNAAANHIDEYRKIIEAALKS